MFFPCGARVTAWYSQEEVHEGKIHMFTIVFEVWQHL